MEGRTVDRVPAASGADRSGGFAPQDPALATATTVEDRTGSADQLVRDVVAAWLARLPAASEGRVRASDARVAVHLRDRASGQELASLLADESMRPASNLKLVTTAAALVLLGPAVDFTTPVEARGELKAGVLHGDLVIRAAGDPLVVGGALGLEGAVEAPLRELARELVGLGLRRIEGDLVLDEGSFLEPAAGPAWPDPSQHWAEYCALAGGFSANGGVLVALVTPTRVGEPARVSVHPRPHGLAKNYGVRTVAGSKVDVRVGATRTRATVKGTYPSGAEPYRAEFAHPDPIELFGSVLLGELRAAGISLGGRLVRRRGTPPGRLLAELRSPLEGTLAPINRDSRNGVADQLFLALGNAFGDGGTRDGGGQAVALALETLGVPAEGLRQVDGSGLSRDNRVTARQITVLLAAVLERDPELAALFVDSLPQAGRTGTLRERLRGTLAEGRVLAKTGWIAGTSALSGLIRTLDGRELVFSILAEYPASAAGLNTRVFKPLQDELVTLFVETAL